MRIKEIILLLLISVFSLWAIDSTAEDVTSNLAELLETLVSTETPEETCLINLQKIDASTEQWALEYRKENGEQVKLSELVGLYELKDMPVCPSGGKYPEGLTVGKEPYCSTHGTLSQLKSKVKPKDKGLVLTPEEARQRCLENLVKIEEAAQMWAVQHNKLTGEKVKLTDLIGKDEYLRARPICPYGGKYPEVLTVGKTPSCSIHGSISPTEERTYEKIIRQHVERLSFDMRSLAGAIRGYYIDNNQYPVFEKGENKYSAFYGFPKLAHLPSFRYYAGRGSAFSLTTPIAYISKLPKDVFAPEFAKDKPTPTLIYYSIKDHWLLVSPGPDQLYDINPVTDFAGKIEEAILKKTYDPTNGVLSRGDIWSSD